ncbi:ABC transporter ATP-binding protein [Candidatus Omnitrophota bacterium]
MSDAVLRVEELKTYFYGDDAVTKAVDGVSFDIPKGRVLGLVGESGCGKTVTALSIMNLVPAPGKVAGGRILFEGADLLKLPLKMMRALRGSRISMIFQDPFSALNPVFTVGYQVSEAITAHRGIGDKAKLRQSVMSLLETVEIKDPARVFESYPHTLSGGLRQRAMLAMALANEPSLLIADEPTTALDVTIQKEILELLIKLKEKTGMSILFITHNFGTISMIADLVGVMYMGKIVEFSSARSIFNRALHPYTKGLLNAVPRIGSGRISGIEEIPPEGSGSGCPFYPRCKSRTGQCVKLAPALREVEDGHFCACL